MTEVASHIESRGQSVSYLSRSYAWFTNQSVVCFHSGYLIDFAWTQSRVDIARRMREVMLFK